MRYSQAFIPTIKEVPKDAVDASHILLLRGGYVRMVGAGIYEMLPLGHRVLHRVMTIIREELNRSGAQEVLMPALLPATYFQETGRWDVYGDVLLRIKDRKGGDYHLGPTHEEIITDMVRREVKSYRQLPLNLYQIQMKYRDEARPRAGLMRCREFLMKDAYSFDVSEAKAFETYGVMREAYHRIFTRLGLDYRVVAADSGQIGGKTSAEFQILAQSGEDRIAACGSCDYAANLEVAEAVLPESTKSSDAAPSMSKVATPKTHTIEDVVRFFAKDGIEVTRTLKTLAYVTDAAQDRPSSMAFVVVRGDHEANDILIARQLGVGEVHLATDADVRKIAGAGFGSLGPVGLEGVRVLVDHAAAAANAAVAGANEDGHHLTGVVYGRDYQGEVGHFRLVTDGDGCPRCGGRLETYRGIEGGHIFVLGTHYSAKMNATFLDEQGESKPFVMGCYGIGVTRLMAAAIEQHHDSDGIRWPMSIAPYQVVILPLGQDSEVMDAATKLYQELQAAGVEVLLDDRDERPGVKFKDADLIGIPLRVTVGARGLKEGKIETKQRGEKDAVLVDVTEAAAAIVTEVQKGLRP